MIGIDILAGFLVAVVVTVAVRWRREQARKKKAGATIARLEGEWRLALDAAKREWDKEFAHKHPMPLPPIVPSGYPPIWSNVCVSFATPHASGTVASFPGQFVDCTTAPSYPPNGFSAQQQYISGMSPYQNYLIQQQWQQFAPRRPPYLSLTPLTGEIQQPIPPSPSPEKKGRYVLFEGAGWRWVEDAEQPSE